LEWVSVARAPSPAILVSLTVTLGAPSLSLRFLRDRAGSALEWVIDQYQVSTDKRSGITNDPNRADDPQYILRLVGQVIAVSLDTVKIVASLPPLGLPN
jgi:predicted helicase